MSTEETNRETEIIRLEAENKWLKDVNDKLVIMMNNALAYFITIEEQLESTHKAVKEARTVYAQVVADVQEANNANNKPGNSDTGSDQSDNGNVPERRREPFEASTRCGAESQSVGSQES